MWWFVAQALAGTEPCDGVDNDANGVIDDAEASIGATDFPTVGAAVSAAHPGDVIRVCTTRSVFADLVLGDKTLTLTATGPFASLATLIGSQQVVAGDQQVTLVNLHLLNPNHPGEAALLVGEKGWVTATNLTADSSDPAVEVFGDLHSTGGRFTTAPTVAPANAAIVVQPFATASLGNTNVSGSPVGVRMNGGLIAGGVIRDNGTGILVRDAAAVVAGSLVTKNSSNGIDASGSQLTLNQVTVSENKGTGVFMLTGSGLVPDAWITDSVVSKNVMGGVRTDVPLAILNSDVTDNSGSGIVTLADVKGEGTNVTHNVANRGGGMVVLAPVTVSGLRIADNTALLEGGGMLVNGGDGVTVLDHLLIVDNDAGTDAAGILVRSATEIENSALLRNTAPAAGGALLTSGKHWLASTCTSWGDRVDDNTIDDVLTDAGAWTVTTEDLRCDSGGCIPSAALCNDPGGDVLGGR